MKKFIHGNTYYSHAHPNEEFDRNFKKMMELGMNAVRVAEIWPGWSVIEHAPGKYDYDILDDYVEKAIKNGLKVCMGVGINDTPFWLYSKYEDLRFKSHDGKRSTRRVQSACFDHKEYREHMKAFIEDITKHYTGVEGIFSWQFGNEIRYGTKYCDCQATRERFREWLKVKYKGDLNLLNKEWGVYYHQWNEIYPYKSYDGPPTEGIAPHCISSLEFQNWSLEELISWGVDIMKKYADKPIFHNCMNYSGNQGSQWKLTAPTDIAVIDIYATTYENPGIYNGFLLETMRSIATQQKKPLWIGETSAGQYGTYERNYVDQRLIENCTIEQIGAGAEAVFYFRHKAPVWEQPHKFTGSQTFLRIDESEMEYAKTPKNIAAFMERHEDRILSCNPVKPEIGIYYPSESINFGKEVGYHNDSLDSAFGARAIWAGAQMPVELLDTEGITRTDLSSFKVIHVPVAYLLPSSVGEALRKYVEQGGTLICEGRPGYVDEKGLLYEVQPGAGLHEVFGAREDMFYNVKSYEAKIKLGDTFYDTVLPGFKQSYRLMEGKAFITCESGEVCGVFNEYGRGKAYLIGGAPSLHYRVGSGKYESGKASVAELSSKHRNIVSSVFRAISEDVGVRRPVQFQGGSSEITVRYLKNHNEMLVFLVNYSPDSNVEVVLDRGYEHITELDKDGDRKVSETVIVKPYGWKVLSVK